jgi:hypothetical protein
MIKYLVLINIRQIEQYLYLLSARISLRFQYRRPKSAYFRNFHFQLQ